MDKVEKNLKDLERKLTKANKIAAKGDDMKLGDAIKLGRKSNSMVSTIKKGIKEYDGTDPTPEESQKLLTLMTKVVDLTEEQITQMIKSQPVLTDKLHVGGLVKRSLTKTNEASSELSKLMVSKAPANLKAEAEALVKRRDVAFEKGLAAYSNASGGEDQADGEDDSD